MVIHQRQNILQDESYIGILCNHQQEIRDGKRIRYVPAEEQYREQRALHRYAGLLACGDCGSPFVAINRDRKGKRRVEYICKSYMRYGKETCASHRIHEEVLDATVREHSESL